MTRLVDQARRAVGAGGQLEAHERLVTAPPGAPNVLVGMLYSGERQFEDAVRAVASQAGVTIDLLLVAGYPNVLAHRTLYTRFMERAADHDVFVKLDADMVLRSATGVADACRHLAVHRADHGVFAVDDWLSCSRIHGVHVLRSHARWDVDPEERIFVDPDPTNLPRKIVVDGPPAPLAVHNEAPDDAFAFEFGVHRAGKVLQRGYVWTFRCGQARDQLALLERTFDAYREHGGRQRLLALEGARRAFARRGGPRGVAYRSQGSSAWFLEATQTGEARLRAAVEGYWASGSRKRSLERSTNLRCALGLVGRVAARVARVLRPR